jgi:hypothetical protein
MAVSFLLGIMCTNYGTYNNHIKDLGLHTLKDMEFSKKCSTSNMIRRLMPVQCGSLPELQRQTVTR